MHDPEKGTCGEARPDGARKCSYCPHGTRAVSSQSRMTRAIAEKQAYAIAMDEAFSDALESAGLDRWGERKSWPRAVRIAYAHKRQADESWSLHQRWNRARTRTEQDAAIRDYHHAIGQPDALGEGE